MLRMVRESEPQKPAAKLSTAEALPMIAANQVDAAAAFVDEVVDAEVHL